MQFSLSLYLKMGQKLFPCTLTYTDIHKLILIKLMSENNKKNKNKKILKIFWVSAIIILNIGFIATAIRLYYFYENRR